MFEGATSEQLNIIQDTEGYQRVCAVPGSGKTFSILDKDAQIDLIRLVAEEQGISLKDNTAKYYMDCITGKKQSIAYVSMYMIRTDKSQLLDRISLAISDSDNTRRILFRAPLVKIEPQ